MINYDLNKNGNLEDREKLRKDLIEEADILGDDDQADIDFKAKKKNRKSAWERFKKCMKITVNFMIPLKNDVTNI